MPVRAVFFDAGDTLIHRWAMKAERLAWQCRQAGVVLPEDPELVKAGARAQERFFQDRRKHEDAWSKAWYIRLIATGLQGAGLTGDLTAMAAQVLAAGRNLPKTELVEPDAVALLEHLRLKGCRLAIISNWDGTLVDTLRPTGLSGYFDAVIDSDVVGSAKPESRIFEIACAVTGVTPDEAVHVGDSPGADVAGALRAGIRPVLYDPLEVFLDGFDDLPRFERISRLSELPALLEA
jgi:HAD superfamily hydrolase (TIGR01549 family)